MTPKATSNNDEEDDGGDDADDEDDADSFEFVEFLVFFLQPYMLLSFCMSLAENPSRCPILALF